MVRFKNRYVIAKIRLHDKQPTHAEAIHSALLEELSLSFGELGRAQCTKSNALQVKFFEPKKALLFVMRCNQRDLKMVKKSIERVKRAVTSFCGAAELRQICTRLNLYKDYH